MESLFIYNRKNGTLTEQYTEVISNMPFVGIQKSETKSFKPSENNKDMEYLSLLRYLARCQDIAIKFINQ